MDAFLSKGTSTSIDQLKNLENYIEIKTKSLAALENGRVKYSFPALWSECFLSGTDHILVGYILVDDKCICKKIKKYTLQQIENEMDGTNFNKYDCVNMLVNTLRQINLIMKNKGEGALITLEFKSYDKKGEFYNNCSLIDNEFKRKF